MDWDNLKVFLHVARSGRVIDGARELGVDHSTVSRRIARLEARLGVRLFERAGRRLRITEAGERLRLVADQLESLVLKEVGSLGGETMDLVGRVRIGAPEGLGAAYLGSRIGALAREHLGLEIELVALPQNYSLASREADIAITLDRPQAGSVVTRKLTDYALCLYGTDRYFERRGRPSSVGELPSHIVCGYIPELLHTRELDYLTFGEIRLSPRLKSTSILAQADMIESGEAIGVLPCFMASRRPELVKLLAPSIGLNRSYWLSIHDDLRRLARIQLVVQALMATVQGDRPLFSDRS